MMKRIIVLAAGLMMAGSVHAGGLDGDDGPSLVKSWSETVTSGDKAAVAAILAPEFQLMRGSGRHYDAAAYVAGALPQIAAPPTIDLVQVTQGEDVIVVTYQLNIEADVDGVAMTRQAPRLTVFRQIDGDWFVSAHANFALPQIEPN
ncbi:MAG: nuclear transport factor 2 family protein [Pseudomonadota bacterium]